MPSYAITHQYLTEILTYHPDTGIFLWRQCRNAYKNGTPAGGKSLGYISIMIDGEAYYAHRLAWFYVHQTWPELIDHINGDRSDNRISNLRVVSAVENGWNQRYTRQNKTGVPGVTWIEREQKYKASIIVCGSHITLGRFEDKKSAFLAYMNAKKRFFPDSHKKMMGALSREALALLD